ncbi:MAG: response regulator [Deltaproteobacteria bacterium]|nr:response regulator [Deltaproteobacteria bacterium]
MTDDEIPSGVADDMRRRAEEVARSREERLPETPEAPSPEAAQRLLHELRVHQVELEMQNEELRRVQEQLEISRARYFDLYDLAPVGYLTLSEQGLILEANFTLTALLKATRGELVKQPLTRFILPEDQDIYYRHRKQLLETGASQAFEVRMSRKEAAPFWVRLEAIFASDDEGAPLYRVVVSDITEGKRMDAEKAELGDRLRQTQKAESLGRMAGAIAHHFNNQLQAVMGNLELALDDLPPDKGPVINLKAARRAAGNAAEISKVLLTYLGKTPGEREPLDLSEICRRGLIMLRVAMPKDLILEIDAPSPGPVISANANQLQQVLINLVTNAWEATEDGRGAIHLTISTVPAAAIPAAHRFPPGWQPEDRAYACLEVADSGCGIPAQDIENIFDPFFSTKFTGRGLGLPVVLGIVRAHRGAVVVESEPGRRSTFQVFLPLSDQKVSRLPDRAPQAPELVKGGAVLLVEDEEMLCELVAIMLKRLGFTVLQAKDGLEAVELFRQHQDEILCVLCDLIMPRLDGWATLTALRQLKPGIPVILVSGYDESEVMAGDHPERPQLFLRKPFEFQELRSAISQALKTKTEGEQAEG